MFIINRFAITVKIIILISFTLCISLSNIYSEEQNTSSSLGIPVLLYHHIDPKKPAKNWNYPPNIFEEHLQFLQSSGYKTITLDQMYKFVTGEKVTLPEKPFMIQFDDGLKKTAKNAVPLLKKYNFSAVFFVYPGNIREKTTEDSSFMSFDELKQLVNDGFEVESHTLTHENLSTLKTRAEIVKQLKDSKDILEKKLEKKIEYLAYPYGLYTIESIAIGKSLGYKAMFSINDGVNYAGIHPFKLKRYCLIGKESLQKIKAYMELKPLPYEDFSPYDGQIVFDPSINIVKGSLSPEIDPEKYRFSLIVGGHGKTVHVDKEKNIWWADMPKLKAGGYQVLMNVINKSENKLEKVASWCMTLQNASQGGNSRVTEPSMGDDTEKKPKKKGKKKGKK